jgi:hypothetical protein
MAKLIEIAGPKPGEHQVVLAGVVVHFIFATGSGADAVFEALHKGAPLIGEYSAILHKGRASSSGRLAVLRVISHGLARSELADGIGEPQVRAGVRPTAEG